MSKNLERMRVVEKFTSEIIQRIQSSIHSIYLFGSLAKGKAQGRSDIDILVVYSEMGESSKLADVVDDICFRLACELNEAPEVILISEDEYKRDVGSSPFLWEVLNFGKPIFVKEKSTQWDLNYEDFLDLAEEYLGYAKHALSQGMIRLSIDAGYNSVELSVKSLIISTKNELASSHGGIVGQFGQLFVLTDKVSSDLGRGLNKGLRLRALARYKPKARLKNDDAEFVVSLAEELLNFAKRELV